MDFPNSNRCKKLVGELCQDNFQNAVYVKIGCNLSPLVSLMNSPIETAARPASTPDLPVASLQTAAPTKPRLRAFLIGIPLVIALSLLSVYADMVSKVVQFGVVQFAPPAVFALFALAILNRGLMKVTKVEWLSRADLLIIYVMGMVSVLVSTRGIIEKLIPPLAYLPYFAKSENRFNELLTTHLPAWAVPFLPSSANGPAPKVIADYWQGNGGAVPWSAWVGPLCAWFGLWCCVALVFLSLATILRRQWMDNEQLRFPLATVPLAIITNSVDTGQGKGKQEPFFTNRLMWIGMALSVLVFGLNGLAANFPDFPKFVTDFGLNAFFSERPLNSIGYVSVFISLAAIGFLYFLPTDLLFSLWFFYWAARVQNILAVQFGGVSTPIGTHNAEIFTGFQAAGAYIILVLAQIRIGWPYFKAMFQTAFGNKVLDDSGEMMPYRTALIGLVLGFGGIILWLTIAGMNPVLAIAQMGLYIFFISIIMTRSVCEAGILMTETSFLPSHLMNLASPITSWGAQNITLTALTNIVFARDMRGVLLSPFMDSQKIAKELNVRPRSLILPIVLALVIAFVSASAFFLHFNYSQGGLSLYSYANQGNPGNMYNMAAGQINGAALPRDATAWGGLILGSVATLAMVWARSVWTWFPFHPLGYAIAPTWTMTVFWFPAMAAWTIKSLIVRFGGIDVYRKFAPFMLGLIIGEFGMAVFFSLMNMWRAWSTPSFPWP